MISWNGPPKRKIYSEFHQCARQSWYISYNKYILFYFFSLSESVFVWAKFIEHSKKIFLFLFYFKCQKHQLFAKSVLLLLLLLLVCFNLWFLINFNNLNCLSLILLIKYLIFIIRKLLDIKVFIRNNNNKTVYKINELISYFFFESNSSSSSFVHQIH